jgi:hypothetical protein
VSVRNGSRSGQAEQKQDGRDHDDHADDVLYMAAHTSGGRMVVATGGEQASSGKVPSLSAQMQVTSEGRRHIAGAACARRGACLLGGSAETRLGYVLTPDSRAPLASSWCPCLVDRPNWGSFSASAMNVNSKSLLVR